LATRNQPFLQRYDLRICLYSKNQPVLSEWEALHNLLIKLQVCDPTIQVYPWRSEDHRVYPPIQLRAQDIPFFDLAIYAPRLTEQQARRTRHPYLFLQSSVAPAFLVDTLGTWLRETKQGMWPRQLALAEQTKCLGWLLYSAPEFHLEEIRQQITVATGEEVALRYRIINDGQPIRTHCRALRVRAIHIEVEKTASKETCKRIAGVYSPQATTFPLGIKMRIVEEITTESSPTFRTNAINLQSRQAQFLSQTATCLIKVDSQHITYTAGILATLRQIGSQITSLGHTKQQLFHAVSPMVKKEGYIVRYLLQHSTETLTTLGQIPALIPGTHVGSPPPSYRETVTATDQEQQPSGRTPPPMQQGTVLTLPLAHSQTEELDRLFTSKFTEPYYYNPLPLPQTHRTSAQHAYYSTAPSPSKLPT